MTTPMTPRVDEIVAEHVRGAMRVDPPIGLADEIMRAVTTVPQQRRSLFVTMPVLLPALAAATAAALLVLALILTSPNNVGPPQPTPTPVPTLTAEGDRVLTEPGDVIRIPAVDAQGSFGEITIERGEERGAYDDYLPLAGMSGPLFFIEVRLEYRPVRDATDDYGSIDIGVAVDADGDGLDPDDRIQQYLGMGFSPDGTEMQAGPEPILPFAATGSDPIDGWLALEIPAVAADYDVYLVQLESVESGGSEPVDFVAANWALLRTPGEPVGVTEWTEDAFGPRPSGIPEVEFQRLPSPAPSPVASYVPTPDSEADDLMMETQTCETVDGITVTFPASWFTNEAFEDLPACTFFDPDPIDSELLARGFADEMPAVRIFTHPEWQGGAIQPNVPVPDFSRVVIGPHVAWLLTYPVQEGSSGARLFLVQLTDDPYGPFVRAQGVGESGWFPLIERMTALLEFER